MAPNNDHINRSVRPAANGRTLVLFLALAGVFLGLRLFADINGTVFLAGDRLWFQPIIDSYAQRGLLANPIRSPISANPEGILTWHGWLMPVVSGSIQRVFSTLWQIENSKFASHILVGLIFAAYAIFLNRRSFGSVKILAMPLLLGLFLYQAGRPELVASGVLLVFLWNQERRLNWQSTVISALCIAGVAVTSPVLGIYLALIYTLLLFSRKTVRSVCWRIILAQCVLVPVFIYVLTISVTDLDFLAWVKGVLAHSQVIAGRSDGSFADYYLGNFGLPFMAVFGIYALIWVISIASRNNRPEAWGVAIALIVLVVFGTVRVPPLVYNLAWLIPLVFFGDTNIGSRLQEVILKIRPLTISFLGAAFGVSILFASLLLGYNIKSGIDRQTLISAQQVVPATSVFYVDKYNFSFEMVMYTQLGADRFTRDYASANFRVSLQSIERLAMPVLRMDECLISLTYHQEPLILLGKELWYSRQDWAFAIIQLRGCD